MTTTTLFDFVEAQAFERWRAIDDRVMGGVSQSELTSSHQDNASLAAFRGELSMRNNGGFCSVRAELGSPIASGIEHLWIKCRNNMQWGSKTYYLNLRISGSFDGVSYRTAFTPDENLSRYEFTATEFVPVFRGRSVLDAPTLQFAEVQQIGLMIADSQVGPFELLIRDIGAFWNITR